MISVKFLWGNVFFGGKLKIHAAKNSNFDIFESTLYMKSVSMILNIPSIYNVGQHFQKQYGTWILAFSESLEH